MIKQIIFINNPIYDKTNNIYSLSLAKEYLLEDDTLLLESDLIFEDSVLKLLVDDPRKTLALVDKYESWMDGTCVKISDDDSIEAFVPGKKFVFEDIPKYYKTVNIYKFGKMFSKTHYVPFLDAYSKALGNNEYYEQVLRVITMLDEPEIKAKRLQGQRWYEIDDIQDLDIASSIFDEDGKRLDSIQGRYGGYWRYPKLIDFCYLVNPYFPPQKLINEMKANFEALLSQYPSGMRVNSLLAAKNFDINQNHIAIGNGAAELIKSLMENISGKVGFIKPTFEEYPNRYCKDNSIVYVPKNRDFSYSSKDIMEYFGNNKVETIVLINPDNPSGNYIPKEELINLVYWCKKNGIKIVIDESFVDFAEGENNTLIEETIINEYSNLIVIKSISKSYGVPGLRLGVLVTSDENIITKIKNDLAIWNINSFAEFYMQIEEKYKKDYYKAIEKFKVVRRNFTNQLKELKGIYVIPSQANFIMIEITNGMTARFVTEKLLVDYNIFVKDLSNKIKNNNRQYIRIAVKTDEENAELIRAIENLLQ